MPITSATSPKPIENIRRMADIVSALFSSQFRQQEARLPAMLFECLPELRGKKGLLFPRLPCRSKQGHRKPPQHAVPVHHQPCAHERQQHTRINRMADARVGPRPDELVLGNNRDARAPVLPDVMPRPHRKRDPGTCERDAERSEPWLAG